MAHELHLHISWEGDSVPDCRLLLLAVSLILAAAPAADSAIITTFSSGSAFTVSSSDLLQTDLTSVSFSGSFNVCCGTEPVLRDGANPNTLPDNFGSGPINTAATILIGSTSNVTYLLDTVANVFGYTITSIDTFGHWDEGRDRQNILIEFSTVAAPGTFSSIASYSFDPTLGQNFSRVRVTPNVSFLATSVAALRFSFPNQENFAGGYRELDVFGTPVPEPSTGLLVAMGLAGLGLRGRRQE